MRDRDTETRRIVAAVATAVACGGATVWLAIIGSAAALVFLTAAVIAVCVAGMLDLRRRVGGR